MKAFLNTTLILIGLLFSLSCNKKNISRNVYVYSTSYDPYTRLSLFVNDKPQGSIPYFHEKLNFDHDSLHASTLMLKLNGGKNPITSKDQWGNIKTDATLDIRRKKIYSNAVIGNISTETRGDDILIQMNFTQ